MHELRQTNMVSLYDCQKEAGEAVAKWLTSNESFFLLKGYAGTGKTHLVKWLLENVQGVLRVALCAPTNKAVSVLSALDTGAYCCTIYSLLGLTMNEQEDRLVLEKTDRSKDGKFNLVILDECGQCNAALIGYIKESAKRGVRYLFVGDNKQLNPVGEEKSLVWNMCRSAKLTKVVRHDNQILNLATHVRKTRRVSDLYIQNDNAGKEGVWYLDDNAFLKELRSQAKEGRFDGQSVAIAWRNKTVNEMNRAVRIAKYGEEAYDNQWLVGDRILFTGPHETDSGLKIYTDLEASVKGVSEGEHPMYPNLRCKYIAAHFPGQGVHTFRAVSDYETFSELLNSIATDARNKDRTLWKKFWALRHSVAGVRHAYAITAHRAQGSTVHTAFVDSEDILCNRDRREAKRCLYVAFTRPTTRLYVR